PSGTFFVKIQVHLDFATAMESFSWVVQGGTGAYEHLRRSGRGSTVSDGSDPQTGNINTYVGFLVHRTEDTSRCCRTPRMWPLLSRWPSARPRTPGGTSGQP